VDSYPDELPSSGRSSYSVTINASQRFSAVSLTALQEALLSQHHLRPSHSPSFAPKHRYKAASSCDRFQRFRSQVRATFS
jgi:hypothetical protein